MKRSRTWPWLFLVGFTIWTASAQSPPVNSSPGFFAGEWAGSGQRGSYCYVSLKADGSGWVLIDAGAGDWSGASIRWENQRQSLQVTKRTPLPASPQRRILPLDAFELRSEFNNSLNLTWLAPTGSCSLQRTEDAARRLESARGALANLPAPKTTP